MRKRFLLIFSICTFLSFCAIAQDADFSSPHTNTIFSRNLITNPIVGSTPGEGGVSGSGSATYSIPIAVPGGTNGVVPSVSLVYNSQSGPGIAGFGWNLSGLSAITRTSQNNYFDGRVNPVELSLNDRFALDGSRLVLKDGTYGADGSIYGTEIENFAKVTAYGTAGNGPQYFKILTKDGVVMEFGNTIDSRFLAESGSTVLFWRLNKILNPDGNYIRFIYDNSDRDSRISQILYTGNDNVIINLGAGNVKLAPYNIVKFSYKVRKQGAIFSDVRTVYEAGSAITNKYLLDVIEVRAENQLVKKYQFKYSHNSINSLLKEAIETGSDSASMLNATVFKYGDPPQDFTREAGATLPTNSTDFFAGDYDGNGKSDILMANFTNIVYNTVSGPLFEKKYTGFNIYRDGSSTNSTGLIALDDGTQLKANALTANKSVFLSSDFNGDGLDDILTTKVGTATLGGQQRGVLSGIKIYQSKLAPNGSISNPLQMIPVSIPVGGSTAESCIPDKGNYLFTGDFDGDGKQEFFTILQNSNFQFNAQFYKTYNVGEYPYDIYDIHNINNTRLGNTWAAAARVLVLDFDGDGKDDVLTVNESTTTIYSLETINAGKAVFKVILSSTALLKSNYQQIYLGDFNGDGKADLLFRADPATGGDKNTFPWFKAISTGKDFLPTSFTFNSPFVEDVDALHVADFNGDGRGDIYHQKKNGTSPEKAFVYYSTSDAFYSQEFTTTPTGTTYKVVGTPFDLNGDGRAEMVLKQSTTALTIISPKKNGRETLLMQVQNGMGFSTNWSYKSISEGGLFYTKGAIAATDHPFVNLQAPIFAVSDFGVQNGIGGTTTTQYSYGNAKLHLNGKGYLGFGIVAANDLARGIKTVLENEFNTTYYTAFPKKTSLYLTNSSIPFAETILENTVVSIPSSKRFWAKTTSILEKKNIEGTTVTTTNIYDEANGNVTESTINNSGVETATTVTLYGAYANNILNRPTKITITKTRAGETAFVSETAMSYNSLGEMDLRTEFNNTSKKVVTGYEYWPSGSIKKITVRGFNGTVAMADRITQIAYDGRYRYPLSTTNEMDYQSSATFDPKWGKPLTIMGIDGITTTNTYDIFGRILTTTYPGNYKVSNSLSWNTPSGTGWINKQELVTPTKGRPDVKTWNDILGRQVRTETEGFEGSVIIRTQTYDAKGNEYVTTEPHQGLETPITETKLYDAYNRLQSVNKGVLGTTTFEYTPSPGNLKVTISAPTGVASKTTDASGLVIKAEDNAGGILEYAYYSHGGVKEIKNGGTVISSSEYDANGRQTKLTEANAGMNVYNYDALGQLATQTNQLNRIYTMIYNKSGQITSRTGPESEATSYEYGDENGSGELKGKLKQVTASIGGEQTQTIYTYDDKGRLTSLNERIDDNGNGALDDHILSHTYNNFGNQLSSTYPSGITITREYDDFGYLKAIKRGTKTLYITGTVNGQSQVKTYTLGNLKLSTNTFVNGFPTKFETDGLQKLSMGWTFAKGTLASRTDGRSLVNKTETFHYDQLNRLDSAKIGSNPAFVIKYSGNGNITEKTDAGIYRYHPTKLGAINKVENPAPSAIALLEQNITYSNFMQPVKIRENGYELTYSYNADYNRIKSSNSQNSNVIVNTRYYFEGYEKDITGGTERYIHYIQSPAGLISIIVSQGSAHSNYYTYTDHLGSIVTVTNESAIVEAEMSFDAWGRRRHAASWNLLSPTSALDLPVWLYRGYTQHEHLDNFGLINMNGRMYDPVLGRVLSADNYVMDPHNPQSYNRYTYALNNPLSYTDPDGNNPLMILASLGKIAIQGAIINGIGYWASTWEKGDNKKFDSGQLGKSLLIGAASGLASYGIGQIASNYFLGINGVLFQTAAHAAVQGVVAEVQGGTFANGASAGMFGSISAGGGGTALDVLGSAAFVGGMSAQANGGNFWQGAAQGTLVAALNHLMHDGPGRPRKKQLSPVNRGGLRGGNMYHDRYTGADNPYGYLLQPLNERDDNSMQHDKHYDLYHAVGRDAAVNDGLVIPADARFAKHQVILGGRYFYEGIKSRYPLNILYYRESYRTTIAGLAIGALAVKKYYFNSNPYNPLYR